MLNVIEGPICCRMSVYPSFYREDPIFVPLYSNIIFTINNLQQQRSSVCPLNKGFIVHFIAWLVNVCGSGVASYTPAYDWFFDTLGMGL